jgi:hypothetical protein
MSTLAVNTITNATGGNTAQINGMTPTAQSLQGFRNRIINGNMVIDQRNAGASVTPINTQYLVDRFSYLATQASKFSAQQNAGAVTPPVGFSNYQGLTVIATQSLGAGDFFGISQKVEGFNISDLGWGTASAQSVTVSFWVRSSLAGTFGGSLRNSAGNRSYPFSYTISAANTWEQKTVIITGDTTGTWLTNNGIGIDLFFSLGTGSTFSGTAGAWSSSNLLSATGATSVVGTSGATFYITGVQLEAGSVATPFERRDYGRELIMCERYLERCQYSILGYGAANWIISSAVNYREVKRANPTLFATNEYSDNVGSAAFPYVNTVYGMSAWITPATTGNADFRGYFFAIAEL